MIQISGWGLHERCFFRIRVRGIRNVRETIHDSGSTVSRADQGRALWFSTFAFTVCFAVWTIFAIIGIQIKKDLGLSDTQFGLLVGNRSSRAP